MIYKINSLEAKIKIKFKDLKLLEKSLVHKSYDSVNNYEKLEFLGDRVLGLIISKKLLELYPDEKEGTLDKKLASLVNKEICYKVGKNLELHNYVKIGNSKKNINVAQKKIISDCIEALIGAIYLDKGLDKVEKFIIYNWSHFINVSDKTQVDAKTRLQEYSLKKFKLLPVYKLVSNTGPRHSPEFKVAVKLKNSKFVSGSGTSKKNAEQAAAGEILKFLKDELAR